LIEVLYNNFNYDIKNVSVSEYLLATGFNSNSISYGALMLQTGKYTPKNITKNTLIVANQSRSSVLRSAQRREV
jgi:hypothetical protein